MSASGWITMVLVLVVIWGGFLSLLVQSMEQRDD
jgi:hypothetical protein